MASVLTDLDLIMPGGVAPPKLVRACMKGAVRKMAQGRAMKKKPRPIKSKR